MMQMIDLRSDTVTLPSAAMRQAMAVAEVGDDVFEEDPTIRRLEALGAELTGKDSGLLVTSGTQGNLVSLLTHCGRGDAVILGRDSHISCYEGGGLAALGGIMPYAVDDREGIPSPAAVLAECRPTDVHYAPRHLVCLENTHNRRGGLAVPVDRFVRTASAAAEAGLRLHLDGARLFNACARWGVSAPAYTDAVDTVQLCLSKGLGAPMGTVVCGPAAFIAEARHWRKRLGGGLRQGGIVAAAGIYALEQNRDRLSEDHANAAHLAALLTAAGISVEESPWRTNMVFFAPASPMQTAAQCVAACEQGGAKMLALGERRIRAVTHLDISRADIERAAGIIASATLTSACRSC